ncbi:MAG: hypothetical protein JWO36_3476 [Myxococcales bacterium]|nr:hypothetical protein [Myxococcales bacterium]
MKLAVLAVLVLAPACTTKKDFDPIGGGSGGGGPGGGSPDAARSDGAALAIDANTFSGRVCLTSDPSNLTTCASAGAGGLTVRLGSGTTTTADDGSFVIAAQAGSSLVWVVTGGAIVTSYKPLTDFQIPAIKAAAFDTLKMNNSIVILPGQGSVMLSIIKNGAGLAGTKASANPPSTYEPRYDGTGTASWSQIATGPHGTAWAPGINVGGAAVTVTPPAPSAVVTTPSLPVFDGAITFATVVIP